MVPMKELCPAMLMAPPTPPEPVTPVGPGYSQTMTSGKVAGGTRVMPPWPLTLKKLLVSFL